MSFLGNLIAVGSVSTEEWRTMRDRLVRVDAALNAHGFTQGMLDERVSKALAELADLRRKQG